MAIEPGRSVVEILASRPNPRFGYNNQVAVVGAVSCPAPERYLSSGLSETYNPSAPRGSYIDIKI